MSKDETFLADRVVEHLSAERHRSLLKRSARGQAASVVVRFMLPVGRPTVVGRREALALRRPA
jgi:hypothetical protein